MTGINTMTQAWEPTRMSKTRIEWAARANYYDRTTRHTIGADREHAELIADSMATHLASLNEPTRQFGGVESVDLMSRRVTVEDDGTQIIRPWHFERPGQPVAEEETA